MKITGLQTYRFSVASKPWLFVKVQTDGGIAGWGEGSGEWLEPAVEATLLSWSELLIGRDPLNVESLCADIVDRVPWRGGPVLGTAIAAVNLALYDIVGKAWQVPVHTVLGGKRRDRVRVYTNGDLFSSPEMAVAVARRAGNEGYAAIKGNPLEDRAWAMDHRTVDRAARCVEAVRGAMGSSFDILLDLHASPTPELSVEFSRAVAPYRPLLLEDPVKGGSVDAIRMVSTSSAVPVAVGNFMFTLGEFKPVIDSRACAYLQPDVGHCYGLTHLLEISRAAAAAKMLMAPHLGGGPIFYSASLHADAVTPNFLIQESVGFGQYDRIVEHDWAIRDGYVNVSEEAGLGVVVKERDIEGLPYRALPFRQYRNDDGSWNGW
jgi:galactonate dehydratase